MELSTILSTNVELVSQGSKKNISYRVSSVVRPGSFSTDVSAEIYPMDSVFQRLQQMWPGR